MNGVHAQLPLLARPMSHRTDRGTPLLCHHLVGFRSSIGEKRSQGAQVHAEHKLTDRIQGWQFCIGVVAGDHIVPLSIIWFRVWGRWWSIDIRHHLVSEARQNACAQVHAEHINRSHSGLVLHRSCGLRFCLYQYLSIDWHTVCRGQSRP